MAVRGLDCTMYRNTGSYASPSWNLVDIIKDNNISAEKGKADASTRRTRIREQVGTIKDVGLEFTIKRDRTNADWLAFHNAFWDDSLIELLLLDDDNLTSGAKGLRMSVEIFGFGQPEELEGVVMNAVTALPSASAENPPELYTVP